MYYPTDLSDYVREMNNEIFLSQHQLNGLYIMLLLRMPCQWDHILPTNTHIRQQVSTVIDNKLKEVDSNINLLLSAYEEKIKSSQISKIEKFMNVFKAKNKSMYIHIRKTPAHQQREQEEKVEVKQDGETEEGKEGESGSGDQLMGVFYGISNINALSGLGSSSIVEFNTSERYITFKMGKRYNLTIKNDDPLFQDTTSIVSRVPKELFIHHILPYFGAQELFNLRGVCKEWESYVKDAWHNCFRREMYTQLLASELCKDIQYHYKLIQLRNPFYQKIILLLHALLELIQWEQLMTSIQNDSIPFSMKRLILVLLLLLGEKLPIPNINSITEAVWSTYKPLTANIKERIQSYFTNLSNTVLSIDQLKVIKTRFIDNPFIRIDEINGDDKTPLLLFIFVKQFLLQSLIKNHVILAQEYLGNAKGKLDKISKEWPSNQKFLEGAYKVLLTRGRETESGESVSEEHRNQPDFSALLKSVLENSQQEYESPDFTIRSKSTVTNVFLDKRTKWDIILSTLKKTEELDKKEQVEGEVEGEVKGKGEIEEQIEGEVGIQTDINEQPSQQPLLEQPNPEPIQSLPPVQPTYTTDPPSTQDQQPNPDHPSP